MSLNLSAFQICQTASQSLQGLRIATHRPEDGGRVIDFGCQTPGGVQAGIILAKICMAGMADISIHPATPSLGPWPVVQVVTDHPAHACMGAQYAGWKISVGEFFAMGSGPMRVKRGGEAVLDRLAFVDSASEAVGVLECDALPGPEVIAHVAQKCKTKPEHVTLCVAPTRSIAGVIQVVARSIETALHKLFESGFDLHCIVSGHGTAPLPPIAKDFVEGIGRTNDAILYGGHVTLWVDASDDEIRAIGPTIPSLGSRDYGKPFAKTFKEYNYDFYQVDPGLFAPAMVTLVNQRSGNSFRFGALNPTLLETSFGEAFD
jgi:methenyltetrahydromethanopterin cyclohydrolase